MSSKRFSMVAKEISQKIRRMYVASIREGITSGFYATVAATKQDSSNAAVHWLVGASDGSRASSRALGKPTDLRATIKRGSINPLVGSRRDHRSEKNSALARQVVGKVVEREVNIAINKYARGHKPSLKFYYYNAFLSDPDYAGNANLEAAGEKGIKTAVKVFDRAISEGRTRKFKL